MPTLILAEHLRRAVRDVADAPIVRQAVRDIALHALRSRRLTPGHIAAVARSVGEGIESCEPAGGAAVSDVRSGAWAGLSDALCEALHAFELAALALGEAWVDMPENERGRMLADFEAMERSLASGSTAGRLGADYGERLAGVLGLLQTQDGDAPAIPAGRMPSCPDAASFALYAAGVLLGLSAVPREVRT